MTTATEQLDGWDRAAWCLAAAALAGLGDERADLVAAAREVLRVTGLDVASGVGTPEQLGAQAAAPLHITSALLSGGDVTSWAATGDEGLRAQGAASAQGAPMFARLLVPQLDGLADRLGRPGARILDVGTGVGALAVAYAQAFPHARVVGIDVFDRALAIAADTVASCPAGDRVELRKQDVADFADDAGFDLAWLPAPFLPPAALHAGLPRVVGAVRPGGWLIVGHGKFGDDPLADALNRFKTLAFGGTPLDEGQAQRLLAGAGLRAVHTFPTPAGAPGITVGQAPEGG